MWLYKKEPILGSHISIYAYTIISMKYRMNDDFVVPQGWVGGDNIKHTKYICRK